MINLLVGGVAALALLVQASGGTPNVTSVSPYSRLFEPVQAPASGRVQLLPSPRVAAAERGACNMPMIRADAGVDPGSIVTIERGKTDYKIRAIEPLVCWEKQR